MSDIDKELDTERGVVHQLETLLEHPGWLLIRGVMSSQERLRRNEILTGNHNGMDGLINRDKLISELAGINTVMRMPEALLEDSKLKMAGLLEIQEADNVEPTGAPGLSEEGRFRE